MQVCALLRMVRLSAALAVAMLLSLPVGPVAAATTSQARTTRPTRPPVTTLAKARTRKAITRSTAAQARARALRDLETPRFRIDELGEEVPDVRAAAAIIYNPETNEVLWESNAQDQRSIASITKVMTALVFFESGVPLSKKVKVVRSDVYRASTTYLRSGYVLSNEDLVHLLLIGSDNAAARVLARTSPYGAKGFVKRMNEKAAELGLESTEYADPSGLVAANVSSAYDMARLIAFAAADERIGTIMRKPTYTVYLGKRAIHVKSTNRLLRSGEYDVLGGKTGFIRKAGYCLATLLRLPQTGQQVAVVVLGAPSSQSRFWETRHLFNWLSAHTQKLLGVGPDQQH